MKFSSTDAAMMTAYHLLAGAELGHQKKIPAKYPSLY